MRLERPKISAHGFNLNRWRLGKRAFPAMRHGPVRVPLNENAVSHVCMHAWFSIMLVKAIDFILFELGMNR
jgi:hypothetical protein